ncbi:MAG: hypothetical protein U0176_11105 [Bacteroidia bacterium]
MGELDKQISTTTNVIASLEEDITKIKAQYAKLTIVTYKAFQNRNTSFYLMSSSSIAQGYRRMQYFQAIQRMQISQVELLKRTKAFLSQKHILLEQQKVDKERVMMTEEMEKAKLEALKKEQKAVVDKLKSRERDLASALEQNQNERAKLSAEIKKELERIRPPRTTRS